MKRVILGILAAVAVCAAALPQSPFNFQKTMDSYNRLKSAKASYSEQERNYNVAQQSLLASQSNFDSSRTFEVYYGDVTRLKQLFDGIASVSVTSITNCSAADYFSPTVTWSPDDGIPPDAVKISLTAEDTITALNIINKMELPIYQLDITEPNLVDVTFLTGEAIS